MIIFEQYKRGQSALTSLIFVDRHAKFETKLQIKALNSIKYYYYKQAANAVSEKKSEKETFSRVYSVVICDLDY